MMREPTIAEKLGEAAARGLLRLFVSATLGAMPAFGIALATAQDPWGLWLVATWVHFMMETRQ